MVGSDWPVCTLAEWYETVQSLTADYLAPSEQDDTWHSNAQI